MCDKDQLFLPLSFLTLQYSSVSLFNTTQSGAKISTVQFIMRKNNKLFAPLCSYLCIAASIDSYLRKST